MYKMLGFILAQAANGNQLFETIRKYFQNIKMVLLGIICLVIMYGGIQIYAAAHDKDPDKLKKMIINTVIAVIVIFIVFGVISAIQNAGNSITF